MRGAARTPQTVILNWRDRRHPAAGGAELYCERLARELARGGRSVVLLTSRPPGTPATETVDGYRVRRMGGWWSVYPLALAWLVSHRSAVDSVVDSQNGIPFFSPLVVRSGTPVVLLVHRVHQDLFARALRPAAAAVARWLEGPVSRFVYRRRAVVVLSPTARTEVRRRLRFDGPVSVVPCGADTAGLRGERSAVPRIVVVGRLTARKRLDVLVDAMAEVRAHLADAELHLIGDGSARPALEARARTSGARVVFHGRLPDARRNEILSTAWLTVSVVDGGDWDSSLIEAYAAGVPALASRVSGLEDIVRHGRTGWLVEADRGSAGRAVAQALITLADPSAAAVVADRTRTWAARFTWQRTADGVLRAIEAERSRLHRQVRGAAERRTGNDLVVRLSIPRSALTEGWESTGRADDVWASDGTTVRGLLAGADEHDVRVVLDRLAVDGDDPAISVLVARPADLLGDDRSLGEHLVDLVPPDEPAARPRPDEHGGRHAA